MICPNCEKDILDNLDQCPHCGCQFAIGECLKHEMEQRERERLQREQVEQKYQEQEKCERQEKEQREHKEREQTEWVRCAASSKVACPHCGNENMVGVQFCKYCGKNMKSESVINNPVQEQPAQSFKICKTCGKQLKNQAAFCKFCGTKC